MVMTAIGWFGTTPCAPLVQFSGPSVLFDQSLAAGELRGHRNRCAR